MKDSRLGPLHETGYVLTLASLVVMGGLLSVACSDENAPGTDGGTGGSATGGGGGRPASGGAGGGKGGAGGSKGGTGGAAGHGGTAVDAGEGGSVGRPDAAPDGPSAGGAPPDSAIQVDASLGADAAPDALAPDAADAGPCPAGQATPDPQTCSDTFTITVTCVNGPCAQQSYVHTYDVTWNGYAFTGTGHATEGSTQFSETICGGVAGGKLSYHAVYTTVVPGYTIDGSGTVTNGAVTSGTGSGHDPRGAGQAFTIVTSKMKVACL